MKIANGQPVQQQHEHPRFPAHEAKEAGNQGARLPVDNVASAAATGLDPTVAVFDFSPPGAGEPTSTTRAAAGAGASVGAHMVDTIVAGAPCNQMGSITWGGCEHAYRGKADQCRNGSWVRGCTQLSRSDGCSANANGRKRYGECGFGSTDFFDWFRFQSNHRSNQRGCSSCSLLLPHLVYVLAGKMSCSFMDVHVLCSCPAPPRPAPPRPAPLRSAPLPSLLMHTNLR